LDSVQSEPSPNSSIFIDVI